MKGENNGKIMIEFVEFRTKMYTLCIDRKKGTKKAKGIKNYVIEIDNI